MVSNAEVEKVLSADGEKLSTKKREEEEIKAMGGEEVVRGEEGEEVVKIEEGEEVVKEEEIQGEDWMKIIAKMVRMTKINLAAVQSRMRE